MCLNGGKIKIGFAKWVKHKKKKRYEFSWFKHKKEIEHVSKILKEEHD